MRTHEGHVCARKRVRVRVRVRAAACAARARECRMASVHAVAHLTFSLSPLSPLFFSFFIIVPLAREKSPAGFLDGASGAFGEAFGGFPHCRARLLVPPSRLFHDPSSGFWCGCPRPSWPPERQEPRTASKRPVPVERATVLPCSLALHNPNPPIADTTCLLNPCAGLDRSGPEAVAGMSRAVVKRQRWP